MENESKKPKTGRLTFDELFDIFSSDAYEKYRQMNELKVEKLPNGESQVSLFALWDIPDRPTIYRHLIAEKLLQKPYKEVAWKDIVGFDQQSVCSLFELWLNPLCWCDAIYCPEIAVNGQIAIERHDSARYDELYQTMSYILDSAILDCADNPFVFNEDSLDSGIGFIKGMHDWGWLTQDISSVYMEIINGSRDARKLLESARYYDSATLRSSLSFIAEKRGGKRAIELLQLLRKDWPLIKMWKAELESMTDEDIKDFEDKLFNGFDDLLAEWEQEGKSSVRGPKETNVFKDSETADREKERFLHFINKHKMIEDDVDASWDNRVNQVAVCFYRVWKETKCLTSKAGGTSLSRLIKDCGLSICVMEKAHGNALNRMIKSNDVFASWIGEVRASFQK